MIDIDGVGNRLISSQLAAIGPPQRKRVCRRRRRQRLGSECCHELRRARIPNIGKDEGTILVQLSEAKGFCTLQWRRVLV